MLKRLLVLLQLYLLEWKTIPLQKEKLDQSAGK